MTSAAPTLASSAVSPAEDHIGIEAKKNALREKIAVRRSHNEVWAQRNFFVAQLFVWAAILASFGTAIASATNKVPAIIIAICAAVPGVVLLIDKSFSFGRRAQWHYMMSAKLEKIENGLEFENLSAEDGSKALSFVRIEMEQTFPGTDASAITDLAKKTAGS